MSRPIADFTCRVCLAYETREDSHSHWDHLGDPSTFPTSTDIVVGPGFLEEEFTDGLSRPEPDSDIKKEYCENRKVREIRAEQFELKIAGFPAFDYFGDGSFYLVDSPGVHLTAILIKPKLAELTLSSIPLATLAPLLELPVTLTLIYLWVATLPITPVNFAPANNIRFLR